eukprot:TRINITY_DN2180_c0_g1_i1.p1 TRINITY_DN2180_c0_g1~~TRINITY_DN2180_c0_g1_i1.p1  ORF type:complete len:593 (-),score=91.93 TRINITY_DN2180_c0_g1_i1:352-2130(-)
MKLHNFLYLYFFLLISFFGSVLTTNSTKTTLLVAWHEWEPCTNFHQLALEYKDAKVIVICDTDNWYNNTMSKDFDLAVADSQWLGQGVKYEVFYELTQWIKDEKLDLEDYYESAISGYSEYPEGSKRYYGLPHFADVMLLVYRKDIFASFNIQDVYNLTDMRDKAKLIHEANVIESAFEAGLCGECYDNLATYFNQFAWSFGGELWDHVTYKIDGILNSQENIDALEMLKEMTNYGTPGAVNNNVFEALDRFCNGKSAMLPIWSGFLFQTLNSSNCAQNMSYTIVPGEKYHRLSLGGQGLHVIRSSRNNIQESLKFLKWMQSKEIQRRWVLDFGLFSARKSIMASGSFLQKNPFNPMFSVSYPLANDFWRIPEYYMLLSVHQKQMWDYLRNITNLSAKEVLDNIAAEEQRILDAAYPLGPPELRKASEAASYVFIVLTILSMIGMAAIIAMLIVKKNHIQIKASSPLFSLISIFGALLLLSVNLIRGFTADDNCMLEVWFFGVGFILLFSPIFAKIYRIHKIFNTMTLEKFSVSNLELLQIVTITLGLEIILLIVWSIVRPLTKERRVTLTDFTYICSSGTLSPAFWSIFII